MATSKKNLQQLLSRSNTTNARRHFHWSSTTSKVTTSEEEEHQNQTHPVEDDLQSLKDYIQNTHNKSTSSSSSSSSSAQLTQQGKKLPAIAVSRIKSVVLTAITTTYTHYKPSQLNLSSSRSRIGPKVIGTLFGHRKGHVNFVFQREHNTSPVFFVELATPITTLVKEMASGLVRIALECDKQSSSSSSREEEVEGAEVAQEEKNGSRRRIRRRGREDSRRMLVEEPIWRAYCNGKQCGFATKREPGPTEMKILKVVEPISMGAGVLPGFDGGGLSGPDGEIMYMRAKFERVVGSRDSEAFYMMNPDCNGAPELSIYLLRV